MKEIKKREQKEQTPHMPSALGMPRRGVCLIRIDPRGTDSNPEILVPRAAIPEFPLGEREHLGQGIHLARAWRWKLHQFCWMTIFRM